MPVKSCSSNPARSMLMCPESSGPWPRCSPLSAVRRLVEFWVLLWVLEPTHEWISKWKIAFSRPLSLSHTHTPTTPHTLLSNQIFKYLSCCHSHQRPCCASLCFSFFKEDLFIWLGREEETKKSSVLSSGLFPKWPCHHNWADLKLRFRTYSRSPTWKHGPSALANFPCFLGC